MNQGPKGIDWKYEVSNTVASFSLLRRLFTTIETSFCLETLQQTYSVPSHFLKNLSPLVKMLGFFVAYAAW